MSTDPHRLAQMIVLVAAAAWTSSLTAAEPKRLTGDGILKRDPYRSSITPVPPRISIEPEDAGPFSCDRARVRTPAETKEGAVLDDVAPGCSDDCCRPGGSPARRAAGVTG